MKKLMIALGVVAMAVASQAASFKWTGAASNGVEADVGAISGYGNGSYDLGTTQMKNNGTWTFVMSLYDGDTLVGQSAKTAVSYKTTSAKTIQTSVVVNAVEGQEIEAGKSYMYKIVITGDPQNDIKALGVKDAKDAEGTYDYTHAYVEATLTGNVSPTTGVKEFTSNANSGWELKGVVFTETPVVPEPTSAMLLLLGVAGLALKRKQA